MRTCGRCRDPVRWDESLSTLWLQEEQDGVRVGRVYQACPRCCAAAEGLPPPPARTYPPGRVPRHPLREGADLPICGLCREALFEGEQHELIRLEPEDVRDTSVPPGAYACCGRCRNRWLAPIHRRWVDLGLAPWHSVPEDLIGRDLR